MIWPLLSALHCNDQFVFIMWNRLMGIILEMNLTRSFPNYPRVIQEKWFFWHVKVPGSKRLSCPADHQEVSRCCTRGESEESIAWRQKAHKQGIHLGFESQGRRHQKSKTRGSVDFFVSKKSCSKVQLQRTPAYNEEFLLHLFKNSLCCSTHGRVIVFSVL